VQCGKGWFNGPGFLNLLHQAIYLKAKHWGNGGNRVVTAKRILQKIGCVPLIASKGKQLP
jgi:hypothetical protein